MRTEINFIRHGITEGNKNRWYYGALDVSLTNEGIDELVALSKEGIYPSAEGAIFFSSGLARADQTLFLLYGEVERKVITNLREMNFGIFEGHTYDELKDTDVYQRWIYDDDMVIPKGESRKIFQNRVIEGFDELLTEHQIAKSRNTIAVCHGGVISVIMLKLFPGLKEHFYEWIPDPGHGYTFGIEDGKVVSYEAF